MPIFPQVFKRLQEDDSILEVADDEWLEVYFSFGEWPEQYRDRLPCRLVRHAAVFVKHLYDNAERVADELYFPDARNPDSPCLLKMDDDVIVAFQDDRPVWYWERKEGIWNFNGLWISRETNWSGSFDTDDDLEQILLGEALGINELDREEDEFPDVPLAAVHETNDPEYLNPDPLLGVLRHVEKVLSDADAQLKGERYLCDPGDPNNGYRFRSNDKVIVAYGCAATGEYDPLWCWKKKAEGKWKLYKLRASLEGRELENHAERRLRMGNWD